MQVLKMGQEVLWYIFTKVANRAKEAQALDELEEVWQQSVGA